MDDGALSGVRVIELAVEIQGPYAGLALSEMGAEVIKIEQPDTGDTARATTLRSLAGGDTPDGAFSHYFFVMNRGKRSMTLDLKSAAGRAVLLRLLEDADVLLSNFRIGVLERLGFGYETLAERFPRLVYAVSSGWGVAGPRTHFPSRDMLAQAASGLMGKTGEDPRPPTNAGANIADCGGGHLLTTAILAALFRRERCGKGQRVDVSLYGTMLSLQPWEIAHVSLTGEECRRGGDGYPMLKGAWGGFRTADGWIVIASIGQPVWPRFCAIIGRPELAADPRWTGYARNIAGVAADGEAFRPLLEDAFVARTTAEWMAELGPAGILATGSASYREVLDDPQARASGYIETAHRPRVGDVAVERDVPIVAWPIAFSGSSLRHAAAAPALGADGPAILAELGYGPDDVSALRRDAGV